MKVAIVHYWLVGMRGGEKVLEALLDLYPDAVIVTHVYDPAQVSSRVRRHEVRETFIGRLPGAKKHYQKYLPLMPLALELMDMQEFDLVISSESGPAKGVIVRPDAVHISYCHSPMRYIWDHYHVYRARAGRLARLMMPLAAHRLRIWDVTTAARVDHFIANSSFIAKRIEKFYRREAEVIFPPVDTAEFAVSPEVGGHYLLAGEMVSYKRADLAVEAFNASGRKLVVVGDGEMREALERKSGPNITFLGRVPFAELKQQFATCKALVFPGEEDFGIIPVEVMACGRPVIAYGRGGALDTVIEGVSGVLFHEQTADALNEAISRFEEEPGLVAGPEAIRELAKGFDTAVFKEKFSAFAARALDRA
ncbi:MULTISPECIES: glycosyltransferase [Leisingera]|uniref:glycosyltransferase n=1 Tax=Leisingera TaxID=191028 RepID=UPI00114EB7AA|nr:MULTISPECIES: glycosyltransferase [Leisingera]QDI77699.1 glycosyltransferase family 4 protein [Leisingera aquaemixtae]